MDLSGINIPLVAIQFGILLLSLSIHESAHAWSAWRFGDPTARELGRVTLNPVAHIDPIGTILFPLLAMIGGIPVIGWAKPTPVDPTNLSKPKRMGLWISAAGPLSNLAVASVFILALALFVRSGLLEAAPGVYPRAAEVTASPVVAALKIGLYLNVVLAVFNLLPIPPLDGGGVLTGLLPDSAGALLDSLSRYGFLILYALILIPVGGASLLAWIFLPVRIALEIAFLILVGPAGA